MRLLSCQDLSEPGVGQLAVIPGSHNSKMALPSDLDGQDYLPIAQELCAKPGTAILSAPTTPVATDTLCKWIL